MTTRNVPAFILLAGLTQLSAAEANHVQATSLGLAQLSSHREGDRLVIAYKADPTSWAELSRARLAPTLHLTVSDESSWRDQTYEALLTRPEGRLEFDLYGARSVPSVDVAASGDGVDRRIAWMDFGGVQASKVTLHVGRPMPARVNWAGNRDVIAACGDALASGANETACLDAVASAAFDPEALVQTCEDDMVGDSWTLECIKVGVTAPVDPSSRFATCDDTMIGLTNTLACDRLAVRTSWDPSAAIRSCEEGLIGTTAELQCIEIVTAATRPPGDVIDACSDAMMTDSAALDCIRRAVR